MRLLLLAALLGALGGMPSAVAAGSEAQGTRTVKLAHRRADEAFTFFRKELPKESSGPQFHDFRENPAVLPMGVRGVIVSPYRVEVYLRGTEAGVERMARAFRLVDVPIERVAPDRARVTLRPVVAKPGEIRRSIGEVAGGHAGVKDGALVLEGTREWLHRAMHLAVVAEMKD